MHERIRGLCTKRTPNALLIPTATYDRPDTVAQFERTYGRKLGGNAKVLLLIGRTPSKSEITKAIASADIIVVSGGNTLKLMRRWRKLSVDRLLLRAQRRGVVLAGSSAGAICWFDYGHSDSMAYYHPEEWAYIRVRGLGVIPATCCPHVLAEGRLGHFEGMIRKRGGIGIGIDNDCAILWRGESCEVMRVRRDAQAFRVSRRRGEVRTEVIEERGGARSLESLLAP